jgi:hypothetical protein
VALHRPLEDDCYPFSEFQPVVWNPVPGSTVYSVKRNHGIVGQYRLHNPHDQINEGRKLLDKVIIEYRIGHNRYDLFTINDFFEATHAIDHRAEGNIMGALAECIARRVTKYFLKHFSREGRTGGIFDKSFNPKERNNFIIAHTDEYILKIERYPNLVILKRTGKGKYGYENVKELDGLFDYRYNGRRHIIVLESKIDKISVNAADLYSSLFAPLRQLFPEADFSYTLFSDAESIFVKKDISRLRRLKQMPISIYEALKREGVGVLFFTFNETYNDFEKMKEHLIAQYRSIAHLGIVLHGKMVLSDREIILFDGGETPHIKLAKDRHSGMWREVRLTHKKLDG